MSYIPVSSLSVIKASMINILTKHGNSSDIDTFVEGIISTFTMHNTNDDNEIIDINKKFKGLKLKITPNIDQNSIFFISPYKRFDIITASFQLNLYKNYKDVPKYFNVINCLVGKMQ